MAPVPPSALWSQVATRAGGTEDEVQRAVLRAAGFEWDDATGLLTAWPSDGAIALTPPRPRPHPRAAASDVVDLISPEDARRRQSAVAVAATRAPSPSPSSSSSPPPPPLRARLGRATTTTTMATTPVEVSVVSSSEDEDEDDDDDEVPARLTPPRGGGGGKRPRPRDADAAAASALLTFEDKIGLWIKSKPELYDRVLLMESVDVDDVLRAINAEVAPSTGGGGGGGGEKKTKTFGVGARVPRARLLAYLDDEGVAFTQTKSRQAKAARYGNARF